jgi:hypothetical protein
MKMFTLENKNNKSLLVNFAVLDRHAVLISCKMEGVKIGLTFSNIQNSENSILINDNDTILSIQEAREFWKHLTSTEYQRAS